MKRATGLIFLLCCLTGIVVLSLAGPANAALTGIISGTVEDAATGKALSGANVILSPIGYSTVTDEAGELLFTAVPPGNYTLTANLVGYAEVRMTDVAVTQDHTTQIEITLDPAVVEAVGAEAVVVAARVHIRPEQTGSTYVQTAEDERTTLSQPNDRYQFPGLVFTQPGVVPDSTFFPHIRGARENQVGYMIEGIPIVEPNNNVFATNLVTVGLNRMELFTGGWDAQYGSQVGGVINEVVKRGDQVRGGSFEVAAGTPTNLHQFVLEAGDVGKEPGSSWYFAANAWGSQFPGDNFISKTPLCLDSIFKGVMPLNDEDSLTLLAHHGYAAYHFHFLHTREFNAATGLFEDAPEKIDNSTQAYNLDALTYTHSLGEKSYWTARLYRHNNFISVHAGSDIFVIFQRRQQRMFGAQLDYVSQESPDHLFYAGIWKIDSKNRWRTAMDFPPSFGPFDQEANNDTRNLQIYVQDTRRIAPRLNVGLGLRYEEMKFKRPEFGDLNLSEVSPRVGLTYELVPGRLLVRASAGKYVQFPPASRTGVLFREGDPSDPFSPPSWYMFQEGRSQLKPQKDTNRELGLEYKLDGNTLISASAFVRKSEDMLQLWAGPNDDPDDYDPGVFWDSPFRFASNGRGKYRGLELKIDRKLANNLRAWISYTKLNAKATTSAENVFPLGLSTTGDAEDMYPVDWDQEETLVCAASWKKGRLEVSPWLMWGSGFPFNLQSGLDIDPTGGFDHINDGGGNPIPILLNGQPQQATDPNTYRLGDNFLLSLNLTYHKDKDSEWFLDIYNILDRRDVTNMVWYHPDTGAVLGLRPANATYPFGYIEYVPFSSTLPRSIAFGLRQRF
ncbi:MAG: TonB-dependent receptor [Armatimonadetes bacterium]|nr:TonB-dependent receptor [Armatimonadota bacterium]NIM23171.1 TonB-dependent receptor [Armatimonadota bacterium]NIM67039.1 TonB-dependent receptor [Armatimonadota bacterium]NIM75573.1 TonB-dependent receptor [Armatimonadota bacterium]NIN05228.1 TonB-dependent receptor [Armatimonadota bacterium]